jgi:hypothetical protein
VTVLVMTRKESRGKHFSLAMVVGNNRQVEEVLLPCFNLYERGPDLAQCLAVLPI